ncbi:MAG: hypothetical protein V4507_10870 [Verrucomicrobiota bacterium]
MIQTMFIHLPALLAQASGDQVIDQGATTLFKILFLAGTVGIALGGVMMGQGNLGAGFWGLLGGMIVALAAPIMSSFYDKVGMSSSKVRLSEFRNIPIIEIRVDPPEQGVGVRDKNQYKLN